jgi:hypothetical protein
MGTSFPVALSIFRIRVYRLASIFPSFNLATGTYLHWYPLSLVLMLSGPSPGQRSAVPVLGTALRVLKEFFCRIHPTSLHQVTHGMFSYSAFLYHCSLVAFIDSPRLSSAFL